MPITPHLSLTITPPGGSPTDYTAYLGYSDTVQQMTVTQNFGRQGDTAVFPLVEDWGQTGTRHVAILAQSQVSLVDEHSGQNLFAGVANAPTQVVRSPTFNEWDVSATDYTTYADNAIVQGIFFGWTVDQIVISLVAQANCGITAVSSADGGFVEPGPQLASYVLNFNPLSTAWRQLATLASSVTPYGWFVDQNLELHFFDASSAQASGVTFTTVPTTFGSTTEGHIALDTQNAYEQDGTALSNRILVQGANLTVNGGSPSTAPATDTWMADGAQSAWPLRYTVSGTPTLYVGGVETTVVVAPSGATVSGPWVVEQNSVGAYFLVAEVAPAYGTSIQAWYSYLKPVVAQVSDYLSQAEYVGPNGGVYSQFISDSSLTTVPMAQARAQQTRVEYAFVVGRVTFDTTEDWLGWVRAGWTCQVVNTFVYDNQSESWGLNDTFIVIMNTVTWQDTGFRTMQITAVRI